MTLFLFIWRECSCKRRFKHREHLLAYLARVVCDDMTLMRVMRKSIQGQANSMYQDERYLKALYLILNSLD